MKDWHKGALLFGAFVVVCLMIGVLIGYWLGINFTLSYYEDQDKAWQMYQEARDE